MRENMLIVCISRPFGLSLLALQQHSVSAQYHMHNENGINILYDNIATATAEAEKLDPWQHIEHEKQANS